MTVILFFNVDTVLIYLRFYLKFLNMKTNLEALFHLLETLPKTTNPFLVWDDQNPKISTSGLK